MAFPNISQAGIFGHTLPASFNKAEADATQLNFSPLMSRDRRLWALPCLTLHYTHTVLGCRYVSFAEQTPDRILQPQPRTTFPTPATYPPPWACC